MSADQGSVAAPAAPAAPAVVDNGPVIVTVVGQEAPTLETPADPVVEVPAIPAVPKADGSEEPTPEGNRDEKGRFKGGVQDRIDELTKARREAEREAEYWRVRASGEAPGKQAAAPQPQQNAVPTRDKFATDADFIDALTDYKVESKLAQRDAKQAETAQATAKVQSWEQQLAAARAEIPNFSEVMDNSTAQVAGHVAELIMEHDQGAKVAHFFASNPEALEKVNAMSPAKAAFEIGKVAAKFEAVAAKAAGSSEPAVEVKVSKAPPPASRNVGARGATAPKLEDLSMEEYVAQRRSQGASWAR